MYELGSSLAELTVDPGTNLLVSGPPMTGKRRLAFDVLARGGARGEGSIVVSTKDNADAVIEDLRDLAGEDAPVGVVDCVTKQQGAESVDRENVRYASSPVDLTGIGIELSELLRTFYRERDLHRNRVLLYSLSTLLMYSDLQTVFRFLHVFTGRVDSADALGLFVIDSRAHDEQTMSTLKQLFDGVVEVEETDSSRRHRVVGLPGVEATWAEL